jgi:hypothetical protein
MAAIHHSRMTSYLPSMKSPKIIFVIGSLFNVTLVLPATITDRPSVSPATANSVASVTTKDGRSVRMIR